MNLKSLFLAGLFTFAAGLSASAVDNYHFNKGEFSVSLEGDSLVVENGAVRRIWQWNGGNIISRKLMDKRNGISWNVTNRQPDLFLGKEGMKPSCDPVIAAELVKSSNRYNTHMKVSLEYGYGNLKIRKIMKLYPDCPAIACEVYMMGNSTQKISNQILEQLSLGGKHWNVEAVEFFDRTDGNDNLVRSVKGISYGYSTYRGNLLFAENKERQAGLFMLKEAPTSGMQLYYPNGDFVVQPGTFKIIGTGIENSDLKIDSWTRAYGFVTGIYGAGKKEKLMALRDYQLKMKPFMEDRDEMIMMNTWGDRGRDTRVNEAFCLNELKLASEMGITHFQIDDGWQAGRSINSAFGGSFKNIWDNPDYWTPDPVRFPNGLAPIVKEGKKLGIEIGLWFNPSVQDDYKDWRKDAAALIKLYRDYGIRTFKIDGTFFENKLAESRLRMLFDTVMEATDWNAVLNLDVTAGRRGGYFCFNEYGNIFLENRYTDWTNYYPYRTLRNLWMLSRYVNPQILQIEFLNIWRNTGKYKNDIYAPSNYSFDYVFAITMAGQPLAWLETANLPKEAFSTGRLVKGYRKIQHDLHSGYLLPVGNEPSGNSWCGFQSIKGGKGYFIVYREDNEETDFMMDTYFDPGQTVEFTSIQGSGKSFISKAGKNGEVRFSLPEKNSFALYSYRIR